MSLVPASAGVGGSPFTPNFRQIDRAVRGAHSIYTRFRNRYNQLAERRQQRRQVQQRVAREVGRSARRALFNKVVPKALKGRSVGMRGKLKAKRRSARKRMRKTRPGLGLKGARLVKMKFCHRITMDLSTTTAEADRLHPNVDATVARGYKANSISLPAIYAKTPNTTFDANGSDEALLLYKRYKVLRSTISIQSVRSVGAAMEPLMVGINLTENGANEGAVSTGPTSFRGTDLSVVNVKRDQYREKPGLIGAGKTNIINSSTANRFKWSATYHASRWNKGRHKDELVVNWADLRDPADFNANAPRASALDTLGPKDPTQVVYFQPWACHPTAVSGTTATTNPIECLVTLHYEVLCAERVNQPRGERQ